MTALNLPELFAYTSSHDIFVRSSSAHHLFGDLHLAEPHVHSHDVVETMFEPETVVSFDPFTSDILGSRCHVGSNVYPAGPFHDHEYEVDMDALEVEFPFVNLGLIGSRRSRFGGLGPVPQRSIVLGLVEDLLEATGSDGVGSGDGRWSRCENSGMFESKLVRVVRLLDGGGLPNPDVGSATSTLGHVHSATRTGCMIGLFASVGNDYCHCDLLDTLNNYASSLCSECEVPFDMPISAEAFPPVVDFAVFLSQSSDDEIDNMYREGMVVLADSLPPLGWKEAVSGLASEDDRLVRTVTSSSSSVPGSLHGSATHTHPNSSDVVSCTLEKTTRCWRLSPTEDQVVDHSHVLNTSYGSSSNIPSSFSFLLIERIRSSFELSAMGEEVGEFVCFGYGAEDPRVCGYGNGECVEIDDCLCYEDSFGSICQESYGAGRYINEESVSIPFEFSVLLLEEAGEWEGAGQQSDFDCGKILVDSTSVISCSWEVVGLSVQFLKLETVETLSSVEIRSISRRDASAVVNIEPYDPSGGGGGETPAGSVLQYVIPPVVVVGLMVIIFLIVAIVFVAFCVANRRRMKSGQRRISAIMELEDIDLLIEEHHARESDESGFAKVTIDKKLFEVSYRDIQLKKVLGEGGSGARIFLAEWKSNLVAFKQWVWRSTTTSGNAKDFCLEFEREVSLISSIRHPVKLPRIGYVCEFCPNGDLLRFLFGKGETYPLEERVRLAAEIASALSHLHNATIIHRDVKPENVLITDAEESRLCDFGLSRTIRTRSQSQKLTKRVGTSVYMAPEIFNSLYSFSADVFSFGVMLFVMLTLRNKPYGDIMAVEFRVASDASFRPEFQEDEKLAIPSGLQELCQQCWQAIPSERPKMKDVIAKLSEFLDSETQVASLQDTSSVSEEIHALSGLVQFQQEAEDDDDDEASLPKFRVQIRALLELRERLSTLLLTVSSKKDSGADPTWMRARSQLTALAELREDMEEEEFLQWFARAQ